MQRHGLDRRDANNVPSGIELALQPFRVSSSTARSVDVTGHPALRARHFATAMRSR